MDWFFIYIRDERKRLNMIFNALYVRYLKRECEKYNLDFSQVVMLTPDEFEKGKKNASFKNYHGKRIYKTSHNGGYIDVSDNEWNELLLKTKRKKISGISASSGVVKGKVCIVLNRDDFHKTQEGDILVTSMTRPNFVPILKKVSGIITNEGGVTCHAAIISRELDIPCIIGTQNATQVLKDGDLVEVDADNGVVRILERADEEKK